MSKTLLIRILLLIVGIIITIDCAVLMIIGKINFGSVVPFIIGVIFVIHGIYWERIRRFIRHHPLFKRVWYGLWGLFILWLISFMVFVWSLQQQIERSQQPAPTVAAIIVLGSGTVAGKPTPTLAKRLDTAAPLIDAQPNAIVITSGGVGFQRSRSEADIMASYLHETYRIPFERILQEV